MPQPICGSISPVFLPVGHPFSSYFIKLDGALTPRKPFTTIVTIDTTLLNLNAGQISLFAADVGEPTYVSLKIRFNNHSGSTVDARKR